MKQSIFYKAWMVCTMAAVLLSGLSPSARGDDGESQAWVQFWASANITDVVGVKLTREDRFRDSDEDKY